MIANGPKLAMNRRRSTVPRGRASDVQPADRTLTPGGFTPHAG